MGLRLRAVDGSLTPWSPSAPPRAFVKVATTGAGRATAARARAVACAAHSALVFAGFEPADGPASGADLLVPTAEGPGPRLYVAAASPELEPQDLAGEAFHYMCLKTHARLPLASSSEALAEARGELSELRAAAAELSGVTLEPSSRGVTGYSHRFREALLRDFDFPEALACVWDGLRPGALSPGSRAALLRAALPVLGLDWPKTGS